MKSFELGTAKKEQRSPEEPVMRDSTADDQRPAIGSDLAQPGCTAPIVDRRIRRAVTSTVSHRPCRRSWRFLFDRVAILGGVTRLVNAMRGGKRSASVGVCSGQEHET